MRFNTEMLFDFLCHEVGYVFFIPILVSRLIYVILFSCYGNNLKGGK